MLNRRVTLETIDGIPQYSAIPAGRRPGENPIPTLESPISS